MVTKTFDYRYLWRNIGLMKLFLTSLVFLAAFGSSSPAKKFSWPYSLHSNVTTQQARWLNYNAASHTAIADFHLFMECWTDDPAPWNDWDELFITLSVYGVPKFSQYVEGISGNYLSPTQITVDQSYNIVNVYPGDVVRMTVTTKASDLPLNGGDPVDVSNTL